MHAGDRESISTNNPALAMLRCDHVWHPLVQQQSPVTKYCKCASLANVSSHFSGVKSIQIVGELKPVPERGLLRMQEALHNASWWVSPGIAVINKSQTGLT